MARPQSSLNQRSPMLSLVFVALWCILVAIADGAVVKKLVDCSKCDCGELPQVSSLDGRVVDVHASATGDDWFSLNESIVSNQTAALFLRSVDPECKVEIKFRMINSTTDILMYPGGRVDSTATILDMGPVDAYCVNDQFATSYVLLGTSVISTQQELGVAFFSRNAGPQIAANIQLLYRQHCPGTRSQAGFALPPPPLNGSIQKTRLINPFGLLGPSAHRIIMSWSITPPTLSCAIEVTFTKSTNNTSFSLNEVTPVLLGITHKVPSGVEAIIVVQKVDPNALVDADVTVEYRAVECGSSPVKIAAIQIASWNNVVKPLHPVNVSSGHDPWQEFIPSFPDDSAQQIAVWYFAGTGTDYIGWTSWQDSTWTSDIFHLYRDDFLTRFRNSILPGTNAFVVLSGGITTPQRYAFLPVATPPILVATARNSTYETLVVTPDMVMARRIFLKASNHSCSVEIGEGYGRQGVYLLPFGFNYTGLNDILDGAFESEDDYYYGYIDEKAIGIAFRGRPIRSIGPEMGIQFVQWINLTATPTEIRFRMFCPLQLETAMPPSEWRYISASSETSYMLLPPATQKEGKKCWIDISSASLSVILPQHTSVTLLVSCLQAPVRAKLLRNHQAITGSDFDCTGAVQVDAYGGFHVDNWRSRHAGIIHQNSTLFAYRMTCANHLTDNAQAPLVPLNKNFVADSQWKTLDTNEYEYEMADHHKDKGHRQIWVLQAKRPDCRVEIHFNRTEDLSALRIVEDYMEDFRPNTVQVLKGGVRIRNLRYLSCGRRVILGGLHDGVGKHNKLRYRQVCGGDRAGNQCAQNVTVVAPPPQNREWMTLQAVSPGNLNQLQQLHYRISFPRSIVGNDTVPNKLLELEFESLVGAESWNGFFWDFQVFDTWRVYSAETHGVWLNHKIRAIVGKQYVFRDSVEIRLDSLLRTKKGDHLFTLRYRTVDAREVHREIRLGEVLTATSKSKTLQFTIPQQFSTQQLHEILKKKQFEYEYEDVYGRNHPTGDFPIWFFRHQYTIRPSNPKCQVALKFTSMDIGSGYLAWGSGQYKNEQHRLSVMLNSNGTRRIPLACKFQSVGAQRMATPLANETLCVRMDRTYVSAPGSTMALLFRSTDVGEYEYEYDDSITGVVGPEVTFGSGWTATYQQVCNAKKAEALATIPSNLVTAKPVKHDHEWQQNLPGLLKSDKYRLFRDKRWTIIPQQTGCAVQCLVHTETPVKDSPYLLQLDDQIIVPDNNMTFINGNVTVIQLGTSKDTPFVIKYRQICRKIPTASPTTPSPTVIAHSKVDGETCAYDGECASGICSKILQRCTAKTCAAQCTSKSSSQAICQAFVFVGCSCQWSSQSGSCVMIP